MVEELYDQRKQRRDDKQLSKIRKEKIQCIEETIKLNQEDDVRWKDKILRLAMILERELLVLDQDWLVSSICEEMRRIYQQYNIKMWPWLEYYLPSKYKNPNKSHSQQQNNPPIQSNLGLSNASGNLTDDSSTLTYLISTNPKLALDALKTINKMTEYVPRDLVADFQHQNKIIDQNFCNRATKQHIALLPDNQGNDSDSDNNDDNNNDSSSAASSTSAQVTIDKPQPRGSLTHDAIGRAIIQLTKVQKRVFEFPPQILEKDQEIALGWDTWASWMDPSLDLKYSQNWMEWFRTEKYRDIYGKHAAAVMSFSLTNLCAQCSDETNREWVRMEPRFANSYATYQCLLCKYQMDTVCPNCNLSMKLQQKPVIGWQCSECNGTVPLSRDLTREQVGDKSSIIVDAALQVLDHIPNNIAFCSWYSDWIRPFVGGRKKRLSQDLSEKA